MTERLCRLLKYAQTRVLEIDDINHCVENRDDGKFTQRSDQFIFKVTTALRDLMALLVQEHVPVSIVLAGIKPALRLREINSQLAYRFKVEHVRPYRFEQGHADEFVIFVNLINSVLSLLPLREQKEFTLTEHFPLCAKLHYATGGYVGILVELIKEAATHALGLGHESLDRNDLDSAFTALLSGDALPRVDGVPISNPFGPRFHFPQRSSYAEVVSFQDLMRPIPKASPSTPTSNQQSKRSEKGQS